MKKTASFLLPCLLLATVCAAQSPARDWLLGTTTQRSEVVADPQRNTIELRNGLISRRIQIAPNAATTDFRNLTTGEQFVRSVRPEARVILNGTRYNIGGLYGQKEHAYLLESWLPQLTANARDFQYFKYELAAVEPHFTWNCQTWVSQKNLPTGKALKLFFKSGQPELAGIEVVVHYEMFDHIPVLSKWITIENKGTKSLKINQVVSEILATPEEESAVVGKPEKMKKPQKIFIENNFAYNNAMRYDLSDQATHWHIDSTYTSQVNYNYETPCVVEVYPFLGVGIDLSPGKSYQSIRSYELLLDNYDRERSGLARRKMYH
jgi:hypothetical protein